MEFSILEDIDVDSVYKISVDAFNDLTKESYLKMSEDRNYKFFVAKGNGEVVGFIVLLVVDEKTEIIKIATKQEYKRMGVARALLRAVEDYSKKLGHTGIMLEVNEHNEPAIKLYESFGFKEIHRRKKYYGNLGDAIIMVKLF